MNLVGSKVGLPQEVSLSELTNPADFFKIRYEIEAKAREASLLDYFKRGARTVQKLSVHASEESFFKSALDRQRMAAIKEYKEHLYKLVASNGCAVESLRIINDPDDLNPSPDGKRKSSQEAARWRGQRVVVSKTSVINYIHAMSGETIEGPEHLASKQIVKDLLPVKYISVYTDQADLTEDERLRVAQARPPDSLAIEYMIEREAELNDDIARHEVNDNLDAIKAKITDLPLVEKSFQDSLARHNMNLQSNNKIEGSILSFVNKHLPISHSLCEDLVIANDYAGIWKSVDQHYISMCSHHLDPDEKVKFPPFDQKKENMQGFKKRLTHHLAHLQCLGQQLHLENREKTQVDYQACLVDCLLDDSAWSTKHSGPTGPVKEVKDATVRALIKSAFKHDKIYHECIMSVLRLHNDATPMQLLTALLKEEKLQSRTGVVADNALSVNAVQSAADGICQLHGEGHSDAKCKLQSSGKVVFDVTRKEWVYKDTGDAFKRKASTSSDDHQPNKKKAKHDKSPDPKQGKSSPKKDKKDKKEDFKDKKKEKQKQKQEKNSNKKVGKIIDGLKDTLVNLVQNQSSSSSSVAASVPAAAQAAPSQDAVVIAAIGKQFTDLKKSLGIEP